MESYFFGPTISRCQLNQFYDTTLDVKCTSALWGRKNPMVSFYYYFRLSLCMLLLLKRLFKHTAELYAASFSNANCVGTCIHTVPALSGALVPVNVRIKNG
jgi:hypothetical protein